MKLTIYDTYAEAIKMSNDIHNFLTLNRPRYNAVKWSELNKSDAGQYAVKIPYDYQKWPVKLAVTKLTVEKLPIDWKVEPIEPIKIEPILIKGK